MNTEEGKPKEPEIPKGIFNTALFDQAMTGMEQIAELVAKYHKELIKNGIPENLAHDLIVDYQKRLMYGFGEQ